MTRAFLALIHLCMQWILKWWMDGSQGVVHFYSMHCSFIFFFSFFVCWWCLQYFTCSALTKSREDGMLGKNLPLKTVVSQRISEAFWLSFDWFGQEASGISFTICAFWLSNIQIQRWLDAVESSTIHAQDSIWLIAAGVSHLHGQLSSGTRRPTYSESHNNKKQQRGKNSNWH